MMLVEQDHRLHEIAAQVPYDVLVVLVDSARYGGGSIARKYIAAARDVGASEFVCDQIGIHVSRLNAKVLATALGEAAFPKMPESAEDLMAGAVNDLIGLQGDLKPCAGT
jgi:uridylate kinase